MAEKVKKRASKRDMGRFRKKARIRRKISGTTERPRLSVFKSLSHLYVQLIDDTAGRTLVAASTLENEGSSNKESAQRLGAVLAERALAKNINQVVFDRNGYRYHGKIKAIADAAREAGLKF